MKILMVKSASFVNKDMLFFLKKIFGSSSVDELYYDFKGKNIYVNEEFNIEFENRLTTLKYDVAMSTVFYPVIARICYEKRIKYISWPYDAPMNVLPCEEMGYETNYIFHFDKKEVEKYEKYGYDRFWHMPLAVNTTKYDIFTPDKKYKADISFMGKLYRSQIAYIKEGLSGEINEYIDKVIEVQRKMKDKWIVDDLITQPIIDEINRQYEANGNNLKLVKQQLSYTIAEYITWMDRTMLLEMLGRRFEVHLYTLDYGEQEKRILKNVKRHGAVDYENEMPVMFKSSKINLNSSLRSAQSAIPLRALDIMGCGAFLMTNPQPEICEFFEDKKEVVIFDSIDEALDLAGYYLKHDDERRKIAVAGYENVKKNFRYEDKLYKMFSIAGII
ncbi:MAG: glycosyltransferase [Butyrivibrio sp.]|uniref:CgeB family protein n=1 Tax=Butyrivibrio sp. TaxID=28121 RepID=UPI001AFE101B|nr:glycosyltransferase [Butyrivibrio sp.]MBO6241714.1 glycosyltransferase [Butyrivibrio sp.]